jgi:glycosyltransferase involved in cell wall biosynthesis
LEDTNNENKANNENLVNKSDADVNTDNAREAESKVPHKPSKRTVYLRNKRRNYVKQREGGSQPEKSKIKKVSVVVPLLNEAESVLLLAGEIRKSMKSLNVSYEVIFVDDGSTDKSLKIIKDICRQDKRFKYISFNKNYGKSAALQIGFKQTTGDVVITMDADLQDDPNEIPALIAKIEEGYDLVSGWKKVRHDPFIKKTSSKFFNFVTGLMSGIKIHDFNCGLKAYKKSVVETIHVYGELHRYMPVLASWNGFKVGEIPVKHHPRRYGKTKFGVSRFFKGFIDLLTVYFTTRYIKRPMHFFGFLGVISFIIGLGVNGYLAFEKIFGDKALSNRPLLFLGMLLIIVGIQFFSVGLLGEMLVHNSMDDKDYIIKDKNCA